jgi:hypothetical protein
MMHHRDAWAEERRAPSREAWEEEQARERLGEAEPHAADAPRRVQVPSGASSPADTEPDDVLVVVSKIKKYVRARSGMNTSDGVVGPLSDHLRRLCDEAVRNAVRDGRRTVLDRDFAALLRGREPGPRPGHE